MADKRISGLAAIDSVAAADLFAATDATDTTEDKKVTAQQVLDFVAANHTHAGSTINAQTGTGYTLVLADAGKLVTLTNAGAITLTVPPNSSVAFAVGDTVNIAQLGAGQVTVAEGAGVTVNTAETLVLQDQYSTATLVKTATDTWLLAGRLVAL